MSKQSTNTNTIKNTNSTDEPSHIVNHQMLLDAAIQTNQELELLYILQNTISNKLDHKQLADAIVKTIYDLFQYDHVSIGLVQNHSLVTLASHDSGENLSIKPLDKLSISHRIFTDIYQTQEAQISYLDSAQNSFDTFRPWVLLTPLIINDKVIGIVSVSKKNRNWTEADKSLLTKTAVQLSLAIDNANLHTQVKQDFIRTESLYKIGQAIHSSKELDSFMTTILDITREAVDASWGLFQKINETTKEVEYAVQTPGEARDLKTFENLQSGIVGLVISQAKPALIGQNTSSLNLKNTEYVDTPKTGSTIIAPLVYEKKVLALLTLRRAPKAEVYTDKDIELIKSIGTQVATAFAQYELKQVIEHQAFHDSLTDLANRLSFEYQMRKQFLKIAEYSAQNTAVNSTTSSNRFAIIVLDLDGFKDVNDLLGHDVGDELLKAVAKRLQSCTSKHDTLARMGGDEFAVLVKNVPSQKAVESIAQRYLNVLKNSFAIGPHIVTIGTSIGVSLYPDDAHDSQSLLKHADMAMYEAKHTGKNTVYIYQPELSDKLHKRFAIETDLWRALETDELALYYQPQFSLITKTLIGTEALLRWNHAEHGLLEPNQFLPHIQDRQLLLDLNHWILTQACKQNVLWQSLGHPAVKVAVNLSALQFASEGFIDDIKSILNSTKLDPQYLELELTENMVMHDTQKVLDQLHTLKELGLSIAIDDFGTGYLSLALLQKLPVDKFKIDRSFVKQIENEIDAPIVASILAIAQSLRLKTIAEGVETENQLEFLRLYGCSEAQGYFFSKALDAKDVWAVARYDS